MNTTQALLGRLGLLGLGVGIAALIVAQAEKGYAIHETEIATRPVFDPPGLKYAQVKAPERDGVRGWVLDMPPPRLQPGVRRVVAVGDSLTWGLGVGLQAAWPARLDALLPGAEVFNLGMCGYDAEQGVSLITHHLESWTPDLVIWATYVNDVDPTYLMFGAHDEHPVFVGTSIPTPARLLPEWLSLLLVRHSAMFRSVQAAKLARVLAGGHTPQTPDAWYPEQLAKLLEWSARTSTPVLVLALPDHTQARPDQCTAIMSEKDCADQARDYAEIAAHVSRSGLPWVDGQLIYANTGKPHFMGIDGHDAGHPSPEGHQAIADGMVFTVQTLLAKTN